MDEEKIRAVFQKNFNRYMAQKHITPKVLCQHLGVSATTASEWKLGKKVPRMDKIDKLCQLFNCKRSDLLEEKKPSADANDFGFMDDLTAEELERVRTFAAFVKSQRTQ